MAQKPSAARRSPKPPLMQRLRNDFLTGLVVVLPMFLTAYLIWWFVGFVDDKVVPLIPRRYDPENVFGRNIFGFGLLLFVSFTTLVGALAKNLIGRQILRFGESLVSRTPIVRPIYNGLKQIAETLFTDSGNSFERACLVEYPRKGTWSVAFMSTRVHREIAERDRRADLVSVFVPMTPNPTTGFLRFVPRDEVVPLDMSLEDATKLIISAGLVTEPAPSGRRPQAEGRRPAGASRARAASMETPSPAVTIRRYGNRETRFGEAGHEDRGTRRRRLLRLADGAAPLRPGPRGPHRRQPLAAAGSTPSSACSR